MTQDPNSDSTATAALTPPGSASTPVPAAASIGLSIVGAAALLAGGLAEGGPLLTAGLACLGVHWRTPSQD